MGNERRKAQFRRQRVIKVRSHEESELGVVPQGKVVRRSTPSGHSDGASQGLGLADCELLEAPL